MTARRLVGTTFALVLLLALAGAGTLAYVRQLEVGDIVTGMGSLGAGGVVWGLYVVADGVLLCAGIVIMACACIARFSRDREMKAVARVAMPVALACFLGAALSIFADQGRPWAGFFNLARFARPESPFFATFTTVVAICFFAGLVHWLLARRPDLAEYAKQPSPWRPLQRLLAAGYQGSEAQRYRRQRVGFWMSLLLLLLLTIPFAALAIIFTVRPGWPWHLAVCEAVTFALSAGAGGLGLLLIAAALVGWLAGPRAGLGARGFARLGRGLLLVNSLAVMSIVATLLSTLDSGEPTAEAYARALLGHAYGSWFWGELGLYFVAGFVLLWAAWRSRLGPRIVAVTGAMSVVALFIERYLLLVAWQTHGLALPYRPGVYSPSWIEVAVLAGILALSVLLLLPTVSLIPFASAQPDEQLVTGKPSGPWRAFAAGLWLVAGLVLATLGLLLSSRMGTESFLDPVVTASPMLFIVGLMLVVSAGAVYELLPDPKPAPPQASDGVGESARPPTPPSQEAAH